MSVRASVAVRLSRPSRRTLAVIAALAVAKVLPGLAVLAVSIGLVALVVAADRRDERRASTDPQQGESDED